MKTIQKITLFICLLLPMLIKAEVKEIPFTLDDRDRIIRTEQKIASLDAKVASLDSKIDSKVDGLRQEMSARFDQLFQFLWAIIGIFTTMMVSVFGFAFWDRKLSMSPLKRENEKIISVLRDYSKNQPKLLEILKNAGLL